VRVHLADGDGGMLRDRPAHLDLPDAGVAELWQEASAKLTDPLSALVGRTRATLLAVFGLPRTTTQLAGQLGLSPPAVSQHLKVLKDTGPGQRATPRPHGALPADRGRHHAA
jgi:DNA-binding transcriptional ArsR family regulator